MEKIDRELHPVYGAVPADGDFVQQGEILGLSVDAQEIVFAPVSGWVRLIPSGGVSPTRLLVQIKASHSDSVASAAERVA